MFAKMMTGHTSETRQAQTPFSIAEGDRIEIYYDPLGRPFINVETSDACRQIPIVGDVFLMNEAGDTISRFNPPLNFVGHNADGWKGLEVKPVRAIGA